MLSNLLEDYQKDLNEVGFSRQEQMAFLRELGKLSEEEQKRVLSLPFEIRKRAFNFYKEELDNKNMDMTEAVEDMLNDAKQLGFNLGYHTTQHKIKKIETDEAITWDVRGLENDHRDNDLSMAYYSRNYENIYKNKPFNYIYIIRASNEHRVGVDGKWYRAPKLPIISEIEMSSVHIQDIYDMYKEYKEQKRIYLE